MKNWTTHSGALAIVAAVSLLLVQPADAVPVDLELVLAVDVSGSVSTSEFNLQRQGYVDAFNNASVVSAIQSGSNGAIAATLVYWSTGQVQAVDWMLIEDTTSAASFSNAVLSANRPFSGNTGIGNAIDFSASLFETNGFEGTRLVIDVSGDGTSNSGGSVTTARDTAVSNGLVINGIVIGNETLLTYYENNVIGGPDSFALQATTFEDFGAGIQDKLVREIQPDADPNAVPEPATMALLGGGLFGMMRMRRKNA